MALKSEIILNCGMIFYGDEMMRMTMTIPSIAPDIAPDQGPEVALQVGVSQSSCCRRFLQLPYSHPRPPPATIPRIVQRIVIISCLYLLVYNF